jgi:hypothetical protein
MPHITITDAKVRNVQGPKVADPSGVEVPVHQVCRVGGGRVGASRDFEQLRAHAHDAQAGLRLATVLWLTRSPASCRSVVTRGAVRGFVKADDLGTGPQLTWTPKASLSRTGRHGRDSEIYQSSGVLAATASCPPV